MARAPLAGFRLGSVAVRGPLALGAMAEHTNLPCRLLAKEFGCDLVFTEMIEPRRLMAGDRLARRQLATSPAERPAGAQLLAAEPVETAAAARLAAAAGFAFLDLNAACPVERIVARGWGGAWLRDPAGLARLLAAVVAAAGGLPVTLKVRRGWDEGADPAVFARLARQAGAAGLIIHGRTVAQGYRGAADWAAIRRAREAAEGLPVLGSGGVREPADALRLLAETGVSGVAFGRGALGNPWIFSRTRALLAGRHQPPPGRAERLRILLRHLEAEARFLGAPRRNLSRLARLGLYYARDLPDFPALKKAALAARDFPGLRRSWGHMNY